MFYTTRNDFAVNANAIFCVLYASADEDKKVSVELVQYNDSQELSLIQSLAMRDSNDAVLPRRTHRQNR